MFGQSFGGSLNGPVSFIDFMIFNEVMNGGQKKQKSIATEAQRNWTTSGRLDAVENEDN